MDAGGIGIGIGEAAEAAAAGRETQQQALAGITITHRDVAEGIGAIGDNRPRGTSRAGQTGGAVELGGAEAVAGFRQLRATILQLQVQARRTTGAGGEGGIH